MVVFSGRQAPNLDEAELPARGEVGMRTPAIRVLPDQPEGKLDPMSRLNLGKIYTIEHYVKVKPFGMVHPESMRQLLYNWRDVWA